MAKTHEQRLEDKRLYRMVHRGELAAKGRLRYEANRDIIKAKCKAYQDNNREVCSTRDREYRTRLRNEPYKLTTKVMERLWSYVDKITSTKGCWVWTRSTYKNGYGRINIATRNMRVHRVVWESLHGPIPDGMKVCHTCDNPPCCNPSHLFLGTHLENVADMMSKGRQPRLVGERASGARLTEDAVCSIRCSLASGTSTRNQIADRFGVSVATIADIATGRTWAHMA